MHTCHAETAQTKQYLQTAGNNASDNNRKMTFDCISNISFTDLGLDDLDQSIVSSTSFIVKYLFDSEATKPNSTLDKNDQDSLRNKSNSQFIDDMLAEKKNSDYDQSQCFNNTNTDHILSSKDQSIIGIPNISNIPAIKQDKKMVYLNTIQEDTKIVKNKQCKHLSLKMTLQMLMIAGSFIRIEEINRVRIGPITNKKNMEYKQNFLVIEQSQNENTFQLRFNQQRVNGNFPLPYYVFSRLIQRRLKLTSKYFEIPWQKSPHIAKQVMQNSYIYGKIYKRSQFKGNWQQRYVIINDFGLQSYRDALKQEKASFTIKKNTIKTIETKFDLLQENLIICIKHGKKDTYFGIPVTDIVYRNGKNWLFQFYRMII